MRESQEWPSRSTMNVVPWLRVTARLILFGILTTVSINSARAQLPPQETVNSFSLADGFEATLFASEPMISNPIAIDVDTQGRVWVTEGVHYRRAMKTPPIDKIKVLEDTDGDGVADKMTVFTSDLNCALGICVAGDKVYVPESPNLYVYEDKDGDLKADGPRKTLLTGFGGFNHDHGLHSQLFGPDHKLYMTNGDAGFDVTGPDGSNMKFEWGGMMRCEADGSQLEAFAVNFRNPVELAVDSFGNVWCSDNDNDGLKSTRICWILEGGNYGWFGRPENIRNPDGSFDPIHHWRADRPGIVPYVLITGFGSPCGMTFYEGHAFGDDVFRTLLHCDAGPQEIRNYVPKKLEGVGYTASARNIVTSPDRYFRPIDVCVAPDGAMFVTDWYDGGVGGHAYNDPSRGRIYRIAPVGKTLTRQDKPGPYTNDEDALTALGSPNLATQFLARERLLESGSKVIPDLAQLVAGDDTLLKARALWVLDRIGPRGRDIVRTQLRSPDPDFRALAVRILRRHQTDYENDILNLADDDDPEVVREVLLAIPGFKSDRATEVLVQLFGRYDGTDRFLLETLHIAARGREDQVFDKVLEQAGDSISPRTVDLVRILKPDNATQLLSEKLSQANLTDTTEQALLAALSADSSPQAGRSIAGLLLQSPSSDVRRLALDALRRNLAGPWSELRDDQTVSAGIGKALADRKLAPIALAVIGEAGLAQFSDQVVELIENRRTNIGTRLAAINVAGQMGLEAAGKVLAAQLGSNDPAVAEAALNALVAVRDVRALRQVLTSTDVPQSLRQDAVDLLARSTDGAIFLFQLVETGDLKGSLRDRAIDAAIQHPDVNVRLLYQGFLPETERPKTLGEELTAEAILSLQGDPKRGEGVFLRSGAASCTKCHRVNLTGNDVGPDLSQIGRKYERGALLEAILKPSAGIAPEFVPHVVETTRGKVFAGFVTLRNDQEIVLKTIEGQVVRIPADEIEEIAKQTISLMPELLLKNVTAQDAADLLAYLESLRAANIYAGEFLALGAFPNERPEDRSTDFGPESSPSTVDLAAKYKGLDDKQVAWSSITARTYGGGPPEVDVTLVAYYSKLRGDRIIYYFAVSIVSPTSQQALLKIGSDDGVQVWLNGSKVHDRPATQSANPDDKYVSVQLKEGVNPVLLKVDQTDGPSSFTFSVEAPTTVTFELPK